MTRMKNKPELLAPAGNMEKCKIALRYGADAVYLGGKMFGLRAFANNFSIEEIAEAAAYAHGLGKKVYVTVNIFAHNEDLARLPDYLLELQQAGVDALLISDLGVWNVARQTVPEMPLHVSTQANTSNWAAVQAWKALGAERVVLARELSLEEIREIGARTDVELEAFVHGAMCISYSGRCLLSSYLTGRDGNRGACAQACRWEYSLIEKNRPDEGFDIEEDERGTYVMNSKDLCLIDHIPDLIEGGICSLKIEGRMKTALYVATVARTYRKAIDDYMKDPKLYEANMEWYKEEIGKCTYREFTTGFYFGKPGSDAQIYNSNTYVKNYTYLGTVEEADGKGRCRIEQKNKFSVGETIEIMKPDGRNLDVVVKSICDEDGNGQESAPHPKQILWVDLGADVDKYDILRKKEDN